jgi:hypothetical protein
MYQCRRACDGTIGDRAALQVGLPSFLSSLGPLFGSPPAGWLIARSKAYGVISASDSPPVNK